MEEEKKIETTEPVVETAEPVIETEPVEEPKPEAIEEVA